MKGRSFAIGLIALGGAVLSCQVVMGLHEPEGHEAIVVEGGPSRADSGLVDPCAHASPPGPPAHDDDTETKKTFWFAAQHVTLPLKPDGGVQPGFDLDQGCTCEKDLHDGAAPCVTPNTANPIACDYPNGIDDSFGKVASQIPAIAPEADPTVPANVALETGAKTLLFYLTDYNDQANDSEVSVQFVSSGGLYSPLDCNEQDAGTNITFGDPALFDPPLPAPRRAPQNNGCDHWSPTNAETVGTYPNRRPQATLNAYVTNYTVVFKFADLNADVFGGSATIANGVATAHITKDENGVHHIDGIFAGRMSFADLINLVGRSPYAVPDGSIPFCESPAWFLATPIACGSRDTMVSPAQDYQNQTCDGTSMQLGFQLVEARVSDVEYTTKITGDDCKAAIPTCQ